jgi:hypothetical protein
VNRPGIGPLVDQTGIPWGGDLRQTYRRNSMDIDSSLDNSITLVRRLQEITINIDEAEFKELLAGLAGELADARIEAAALEEMVATLKEENRVLKATAVDGEEKPVGTIWGCYQFRGDKGLYCTGCWDSHRRKIRTNRLSTLFRECPSCKTKIGS